MVTPRLLLLGMASNHQLESFARRNNWSMRVARRFVAGETIDEAVVCVQRLNATGLSASLDYLGESVTNQGEVESVVDVYLRIFEQIKSRRLNANVSVKLTALGLDIDAEFCRRNMERLLAAAGPELFVRMDMEGSAYTQRTLDLFFQLWNAPRPFRNVGVVIQSYLRRSADDIELLIAAGARVRLCKGAYQEPPDLAFPDKADVDANYIRLLRRLLAAGVYPGIATHDPRMIEAARLFVLENGLSPERFEFQMLYGVRRDLQMQLRQEGYRVRVYTPFGTHWYPYFMRRLAERPANIWFVVRNLFRV